MIFSLKICGSYLYPALLVNPVDAVGAGTADAIATVCGALQSTMPETTTLTGWQQALVCFVVVDIVLHECSPLSALVLVLVDVTVLVLVDVLLVSTRVCESYCAAAIVATNAAVAPAIIFIINIVSAPRHFHNNVFR